MRTLLLDVVEGQLARCTRAAASAATSSGIRSAKGELLACRLRRQIY